MGSEGMHKNYNYKIVMIMKVYNQTKKVNLIYLHPTAGLHNSESSKGQIDQHKFALGLQKSISL